MVSRGLELLPGDETLTELSTLLRSCAPATLRDVEKMSGADVYSSEKKATDKLGNSINASFVTRDNWGGTKSSAFFLSGQYSLLDISFLTEDFHVTYAITMYGDGIELLNTGEISWEEGCKTYSVDVSGVNQLEINITTIQGNSSVYMGNEQLLKVLSDEDFSKFL